MTAILSYVQMANFVVALATVACFPTDGSVLGLTFSSKLIHRHSLAANNGVILPERKSLEYAETLLNSDLKRQRMKVGSRYQHLFASEGGRTRSFGNELDWLHYTWIDIGNPNVSFLVGLDVGSDLFWVPCECIQCASFSASHYAVLDKDLSEYQPSKSRTIKNLSCSHELCAPIGNCKNPDDLCPYVIEYDVDNTSSSGYLIQENLHLTSGSDDASENPVQASVVLGCGRKQSGGFMDGAAPDGLLGLGPGSISVPSLLAKGGLIRNSFSICFSEDETGRLVFGDQGPVSQQSTPFLTREGTYETYFVRVEAYCVGSTCLNQSGFRALVDSGSSFTFVPDNVYDRMVFEFDQRLSVKRTSPQGVLENCYNASSKDLENIPTLRLMFAKNQSFLAGDVTISFQSGELCLGIIRSDQDFGIIGQNFMIGHLLVFDRENMSLGWSHSNCEDPGDRTGGKIAPPPAVAASEQQGKNSSSQAISPAVAGRASPKPSAASHLTIHPMLCLICLLLFLVYLLFTI